MGFRKIGQWANVGMAIHAIATEMQEAREEALKKWGLKAEGIAKKHMSKQDLDWEELNAEYLASKIRKGHSENILIATSDYFQAITSWSDGHRAYVGVKKEAIDGEGNVIADIAATHEFGSDKANIPARPLWQPTLAETMEWFVKSKHRPDVIFKNKMKKFKL